MTKTEVSELIASMNALYPTWKPTVPIHAITKAWFTLLKDYDSADINKALMMYVSKGEHFPPSNPGELTCLLVEAKTDGTTEMQAWDQVLKAVRNANYGAEEEFNNLPPTVRRAVGSPGQLSSWALLPSDEVHTVVQSNFMRSYRAAVKREKDEAKLPPELRGMIQTMDAPAIEMKAESREEQTDGVPMPDWVKKRMEEMFA